MKITFVPQRRDGALSVSVSGESIVVNGVTYDLSIIPEGGSLSASATDCNWLMGDIDRENGELSLVLILPHGAEPHAKIAFPEPVVIPDGVVVDTANNIYPWSLA